MLLHTHKPRTVVTHVRRLVEHEWTKGLDTSRAGKFLEITSSSSRASARGMAKIMAMLANGGEIDGVRVLSEDGR